ncbi:MAG: hypothetical protein QMD82_03630 [bacterium]|nr:hypothetical protein [bacterium]
MKFLLLTFLTLIPKYFYNVKDTTTIKGKVIKVEREQVEGSEVHHIVLFLSQGDTTYKVILGPAWFIEEIPREEDSCLVEGSVFRADGEIYVITRKIMNMQTKTVLTLRTQVGFPLWGRRGDETKRIGGSKDGLRRKR